MPIGEVAAITFMAVGFIATWRARRGSIWLEVGLCVLAIGAIAIIRDGIRVEIIAGPITGSLALAAFLLGTLAWAQALGLPRRLACLLGIGLKSRALVFDHRLVDLRNTLADAINLARQDPDRRDAAISKAEAGVRRLRSLHPPDSDWGYIRDDMVDDYEGWIDLVRKDVSAERLADHVHAFVPVMDRWTDMRERAARDQRALASPAWRRRGDALWLATAGFSGLLVGLAQARGYDVLALGIAAPRFWISLVTVAFGVGALMASLVVAIRR
jgi:hypothetical protein